MTCLRIDFVKADPSGNTTALVLNPCARDRYAVISAALMREIAVEQVGFLEKPEYPTSSARLQMMGGEFCGNASRCFAAWLGLGGLRDYREGRQPLFQMDQPKQQVMIEISGHHGLLCADLEKTDCSNGCFVDIAMPIPLFIRSGEDDNLGPYSLVGFEGIVHAVFWQKQGDTAHIEAVRQLLVKEALSDACFGVMFVESLKPLKIRPVVYVKGVNSLVWENSCGSGSLAVAAALAAQKQQSFKRLAITQPGGILLLSGVWQAGSFIHTRLAGEVFITAFGVAIINI
jgi:diaminopimelate epimerase